MKVEDICDVLNKALDLEEEGYSFYKQCAEHTKDEEGKEMFRWLADQEKEHFEKVIKIYKQNYDISFPELCTHKGKTRPEEKSGVFQEKVKGGKLHEESDILDALNIGIKAEEKSIELYRKLSKGTSNETVYNFFKNLVKEEEKHKEILEREIEEITKTGNFYDFKVVTS